MYCFGAQFCSGAAVIEIYLGTAVCAAHCAGILLARTPGYIVAMAGGGYAVEEQTMGNC